MLKKNYYTIEETIISLGKYGLTIGVIGSNTREKLIHPIIYINSMPAHACEPGINDNSVIYVGHCYISAYLDMGDEIIAILDNLISSSDGIIKINNWIKKEFIIGEPKISSWQYDNPVFEDVPKDLIIHPKPFYSEFIKYFRLRSSNELKPTLRLSNILITHADVELLKCALTEDTSALSMPHEINPSNNDQDLCEKKKIWEDVFAKLHELAASIQKGNKMEAVDIAIPLILGAVKKIHPDFDSMKMPGTVEDFHKFCLDLPYGDKIFPNSKNSFGKYCRRTLGAVKQKLSPHCAWENPPTPCRAFWDALKTKDKSYTVRRMTFA